LDIVTTCAVLAAAGVVLWNALGPKPSAARATVAVPRERLVLDDVQTTGLASATVAMIAFSDFECPYCGKFARETWPAVNKEYVSSGLLQVGFRHLPLPSHANATRAAEAATCSGRQGAFWRMHDELFSLPKALDDEGITRHAKKIGVNLGAFETCMNGDGLGDVERDAGLAKTLGIAGTPTFFVGKKTDDSHVRIDTVISGSQPIGEFRAAIDRSLGRRP